MAIRFCKQRDQYSCGAVAVLNVLKWAGCKVTYSNLPALRKLCKCNQPNGTKKQDLESALKALGIRFKRYTRPTLKMMDTHLDGGGIVLLNYCFDEGFGHYAL